MVGALSRGAQTPLEVVGADDADGGRGRSTILRSLFYNKPAYQTARPDSLEKLSGLTRPRRAGSRTGTIRLSRAVGRAEYPPRNRGRFVVDPGLSRWRNRSSFLATGVPRGSEGRRTLGYAFFKGSSARSAHRPTGPAVELRTTAEQLEAECSFEVQAGSPLAVYAPRSQPAAPAHGCHPPLSRST